MTGAYAAWRVLPMHQGCLCTETPPDNARPQQIPLLIMRQLVHENVCTHGLRIWGAFACQGWHLHCQGKGFVVAAELQKWRSKVGSARLSWSQDRCERLDSREAAPGFHMGGLPSCHTCAGVTSSAVAQKLLGAHL